jgi:hypothetical protein
MYHFGMSAVTPSAVMITRAKRRPTRAFRAFRIWRKSLRDTLSLPSVCAAIFFEQAQVGEQKSAMQKLTATGVFAQVGAC